MINIGIGPKKAYRSSSKN